jgi:hypothetical protein
MVKESRKIKFNIIDVVIILFIILAVIGIFIRYDIADDINFNASGETFEIEFIVEKILSGTEVYLQAGEKFYINIERTEIGMVKEIIDIREAVENVPTNHGEIVKSTLPDRVDVTGIMTSRGRTTADGSIMLNGNIFVTENKEFFIHTGKRECWIRVMSIKKVD